MISSAHAEHRLTTALWATVNDTPETERLSSFYVSPHIGHDRIPMCPSHSVLTCDL
jgi:hypothetical protein